jgi:lysozyme family protein
MMNRVIWCEELRADYKELFQHAVVHPAMVPATDKLVDRIAHNRSRYENVSERVLAPTQSPVPWYVIGIIHLEECGLSFDKHLHNGDPLSKPTTHVPAGRPHTTPPWDWTWEESAADALIMLHFNQWHDWGIEGILYKLELYNGLGYRQYHPTVKSPYLWAGTNQYVKGKYVADGRFDPNAVSKQIGVAAILKRGMVLQQFEVSL